MNACKCGKTKVKVTTNTMNAEIQIGCPVCGTTAKAS